MGEAAENINTIPLAKLIEKVSSSGRMTKEDQSAINTAARMPMERGDIVAIRQLTDLIRSGVVKVI